MTCYSSSEAYGSDYYSYRSAYAEVKGYVKYKVSCFHCNGKHDLKDLQIPPKYVA